MLDINYKIMKSFNKYLLMTGLALTSVISFGLDGAQAVGIVPSLPSAPSNPDPNAPILITPQSSGNVIFDQIGPNSSFTDGLGGDLAQIFENAFVNFNVAYIDDFTVSSAANLNLELVEGVFGGFGGFTAATYNNITAWNVEIYSSVAAALSNLTGDVTSVSVNPVNANFLAQPFNSRSTSALVSLPVDISLPGIGTYWLGVTPVLNFNPYGQIGLFDSTFFGNDNSAQLNPGGAFAFPGNIRNLNANAAYRITAETIPEPCSIVASTLVTLGISLRRKLFQS